MNKVNSRKNLRKIKFSSGAIGYLHGFSTSGENGYIKPVVIVESEAGNLGIFEIRGSSFQFIDLEEGASENE